MSQTGPAHSNPEQPALRHNLGLYRLEGFCGRRAQLLQLHEWMQGGDDLPAIAISGEQGNGKTTLATAAAWNNHHHFPDGIIRVGAAGVNRFRLYDIVRSLDSIFGTTLTRVSEDRWGISILEQLYRRKRLLILDELSGATSSEVDTIVDIIGHLHEAGGDSRVLLIDSDFSPAIAALVQFQHIPLTGLTRQEVELFIDRRGPAQVRKIAHDHLDELYTLTRGRPYTLRLALGLMLDYPWDELSAMLQAMVLDDEGGEADAGQSTPEQTNTGQIVTQQIVAFAVEHFAAIEPQVGPVLDRLVSAAGGASLNALNDLFASDLGSPVELERTLTGLQEHALLNLDIYAQRVVMHPLVANYMEQNVMMLGEEWERRHADYYEDMVQQYQYLPVERWPQIDVEWGNIYKGADWCAERIERLWQQPPLDLIDDPAIDQTGLSIPDEALVHLHDLRLARNYAIALAHYAFWRHPLGILRWLAAGAVAALALSDVRDYGWLQMNIGRQLFFTGKVEEAIEWFNRAVAIFDERDMLAELAYALTDLGTSYRILDKPRQALANFRGAFECVAQLGDQQGLATAYMNLGSAYYGLNDYTRALQEYRKALRIALRYTNHHQEASVFNSMGLALEGMERLKEAQQAYEQALAKFRAIEDIIGISTCYNNLGSVAYAQGDYNMALMWYELDLGLADKRGAWTDMAATLHNLGHVALEQGAYERARAYFTQSKELYAAFELVDYMQEEEEMIAYIETNLLEPT